MNMMGRRKASFNCRRWAHPRDLSITIQMGNQGLGVVHDSVRAGGLGSGTRLIAPGQDSRLVQMARQVILIA